MSSAPTAPSFSPEVVLNRASVSPEHRASILEAPGFGQHFTDHMLLAEWTSEAGWGQPRLLPFGPLSLSPAAGVLHYAQEIFEGLKVYRHADGSTWAFRPEENAARFQRSAARMMLPELPVDWFVKSIEALVSIDEAWVPTGGERSLYVRSFMFASEPMLGVRAARHVTYAVIASPVGSYFDGSAKPLSVWLGDRYTRAASGGTGAAKTGGNYAGSLMPLDEAMRHGCEQVVFVDAVEHRYVEELGGMNLFFVHADGSIVTPDSDSILQGIVKESIRFLAMDLGHDVVERRFTIDEWRDGVASGDITEIFACGTAAAITPVGRLVWEDGATAGATQDAGPVTTLLRQQLVDVQHGRTADTRGWLHRVTG